MGDTVEGTLGRGIAGDGDGIWGEVTGWTCDSSAGESNLTGTAVGLGITRGVRPADIDALPAIGRVCGVGGACFSAGSGVWACLAGVSREAGVPGVVRPNCTLVGLGGLADEGPDGWRGSLVSVCDLGSNVRLLLQV